MPVVGIIKPSTRPGRAEELARLLPAGISLAHSNLSISRGTREELEQGLHEYEAKIAEMAALGVDLIHPAGVPPLLLGYAGEREMVAGWERRYRIPVFTNGMSQVNALRAFGVRRLVAASYFPAALNQAFGAYLTQAGFEVLEAAGFEVDFQAVPALTAQTLRPFLDGLHARNRGAEALYLIGPAWRATLGMLESLERDFAIPVIHHVPAQSWEIQKRLGYRQPTSGYGRLLAEFP